LILDQTIFDDGGLTILVREGRYYVRYDAGAHMNAWREDEISEEEAFRATESEAEATSVLWAVQRRLLALGIDPYRSNIEP
jgi:hypothetical protein